MDEVRITGRELYREEMPAMEGHWYKATIIPDKPTQEELDLLRKGDEVLIKAKFSFQLSDGRLMITDLNLKENIVYIFPRKEEQEKYNICRNGKDNKQRETRKQRKQHVGEH